MKRLLVYLKDYKKECILGPLFKLLEAGFDLIVPMVMAAIIDNGIKTGQGGNIWRYGVILVLLAVVGLVCSITAQYFAAKAAVGFAAKLRHALFAHIEALSFTEMDSLGTSTLITRMTSDINQLQSGINMALRLFLRSPFIVFGAAAMAFTYDFKAAMIFVVVIPLLAVVVFGVMLISMPLYRKVQAALDRVLGITRQNLTGVRVIRAFNMESDERESFEEENIRLKDLQLLVGRISALTNPITYIMLNAALVLLLWVGGVRINVGSLSQGAIVALVNYMSQILVELIKLANTIVLSTKAVACASRVSGILEMESSIVEGTTEQIGGYSESDGGKQEHGVSVEFEDVSLTYSGAGEPSLEEISFKAEAGQTIGIIGGTGSGKTSIVHLIPRFYDATDGRVMVDGRDVRDYSFETLRSAVRIVLQKAVLFKGSIRENIRWGNENATDDEIERALRAAQAWEIVQAKEKGLDTMIEQDGRNLSGGQRQRFTIARALVGKPKVLVLDDSSSALDYATDASLRKSLSELSFHPTIFLVSQRTSSILHADKILVVDDGRLVGIGTHNELLESCEVYKEIHMTQNQS